jgi:hypothetical protein
MNDGQRREPIAADAALRVPEPGDTERKDDHDVRACGRPDADPGDGRHPDPTSRTDAVARGDGLADPDSPRPNADPDPHVVPAGR